MNWDFPSYWIGFATPFGVIIVAMKTGTRCGTLFPQAKAVRHLDILYPIVFNYRNTQIIKGGWVVNITSDDRAAPAEDEKRTTLSLSLTASDKKALKMMAAERETTIAAIIHEWVQEHIEEVSE